MSFFKKLFGKSNNATFNKPALLNLLLQRIQTLPEIKQVKINSSDDCIEWIAQDDSSGNTFIENIWAQYQSQPDNLEGLIQSQLDIINTIITKFKNSDFPLSERQINFFPALKSLAWLEASVQQLKAAGLNEQNIQNQFVYKKLNDELILTYVEDSPTQLNYLSFVEAQKFGGLDELHRHCMENFVTKKLPQVQIKGDNGRYALRLDGFFDATLIMFLDTLIPQMQLNGLPHIAVPSRDELLVCGNNSDDIWELIDMAENIYQQSAYNISPRIFQKDADGSIKLVRFQRAIKDNERLLSEIKVHVVDDKPYP